MLTFHIITLFSRAFKSYLGESIIARAIREKHIAVKFYNPRDLTDDKWARVDRRPYGGGPGMVLEAPALVSAIDHVLKKIHSSILKNIRMKKLRLKSKKLKAPSPKPQAKVVIFSASGETFSNSYAQRAAKKYTDLILVCGRYEGIDARVKKIFSARGGSAFGGKAEELSIGPYILTGGELPAMVLVDAVSRHIDGVLGNFDSVEEHRTTSSEVYTRPEVFVHKGKKHRVPKILLSGHHEKIERWRAKKP